MGWRDRLLNNKPGTVGRALKFGGGRILSQQDLPRAGMNKGGRTAKQIGGRANLLEEMGRIDARRHPDAADRAEKHRVIGELNRGYNKGGRVGLKKGTREYPGEYKGKGGKKGFFQKVGEKISRKLRGKELTEVKGIEQDIKTGALTHKAPKDRMDTKPGRWWRSKIATGPHLMPGTKITPPHTSNDMSYKARKKEIAKEKKEADRKKAFDKKHGVK